MIPRYDKKEISNIWSDHYRFKTFLEVELAILKAQEGPEIPKGTAEKIRKNLK
jgi:adenylosuccinate lyase